VVALAVAPGLPARAAGDEAEPVRLPEVVVSAPQPAALPDPTAAATVVEAGRFAGELKGVAELVATAPGVAIRSAGGPGQLTTVSIRGSSASGVRVLLDGIPLDTAAGGGVDLSSIPLHWVSRVEVVRGAEGAYYGAGALGGAVNVVTLPVKPGAWSAEATGGSFGTLSAAADVAVGGDGWALLVAATGGATRGDYPYLAPLDPSVPGSPLVPLVRGNDAASLGGLLLKGRWTPGADRVDGLVQASWGWRQLPGVPSSPTPEDWQRGGRATAALRWSRVAGPGLTVEAGAAGRFEALDVELAPPGGAGPVAQRDGAGGAEARVSWQAGPSLLSAGALASAERLDSTGTGVHSRATFAGWVADDLSIGDDAARVSPALRVDAVGPHAGVSAKLGASVRLAGPLQARASGGHSFRPPSFSELYLRSAYFEPNPDLRREQAWSADGAVVCDGPLGHASAGAYGALYQDLIVYDSGRVPGSFKPFNLGRASVWGAEVEAATAPAAALWNLQGQLAYTFMATEELRGAPGVVGMEVPHRPRHRLYARASVDPGVAGGHAEIQLVGEQYLDARNIHVVPASVVVNAGAFIRVLRRPEVRMALEVRNLLDDRTLQDGFGYPLPSRAFLLTVRVAATTEN
jgi:iron complex outermembrane receptor protein